MLVCCASAEKMDVSKIIGLVFLTLSLVLLSNQMALQSNGTGTLCPFMDHPKMVNKTIEHNLTRTISCLNGREWAGCCVPRYYCNFNTSSTDLSLYGPPGYRMPCRDVCCPQEYILPIPLPKPKPSNTTVTSKDDDSSMDASDNVVDSDSKET